MKNLKYIIAISLLIAIILLFMIIWQSINTTYSYDEKAVNYEAPKIIDSSQLIFNLKYNKYIVPYPYEYTYKDMVRKFEFSTMIKETEKIAEEISKGPLTYVSNYKDGNGLAPLYQGKSFDSDGTLRGAAAPAYYNIENTEKFDYIPDGSLVRIIENNFGTQNELSRVYSIKDEKEYFIPNKYLEPERLLKQVKKSIVVDLKNQTIVALENNINIKYYDAAKAYLKTEWEIVSYSKATTGKIGYYHQPTPTGYFYAIEKKPFFYYLIDGTDQIGGQEPWGIRFTAGAYIHGMSLGEFSPAIGTIPLSHKCVRNYTSHAKFLYDWYEEDKTIVIVIDSD